MSTYAFRENDIISINFWEEIAMRRIITIIFCSIIFYQTIFALPQSGDEIRRQAIRFRSAHEHGIVREFCDLLSIPNVSADHENVRKNAIHIVGMMKTRGIDARVMETAGNPIVYGELKTPDAPRTLMFYVHYDGQPVDPTQWIDSQPFTPVLRPGKLEAGSNRPKPIPFPEPGVAYDEDWRIYARGSSDDRAPIIAILTAIDAIRDAGYRFHNNLKFIFEGEEEASSPNLRPFVESQTDLLQADILFMCDGPGYYSGDPSLFFGVRGITGLDITVYGANTNVHSGHYGNWAPNPAMRLAKLLASMKDENDRVLVDGFYDTVIPLSAREKAALAAVPPYDEEIMSLYGFSEPEGSDLLKEAILKPSLNVRGLKSAWVGKQARTIVPASATASIDVRLVKGNDPKDMVGKIVEHIRKQGYHIVDEEPDDATRASHPFIAKISHKDGGYRASRTSMDIPISRMAIEALMGGSGSDPVLLPSHGGSLPLYMFEDVLGVPIIGVPIANHDNNQHQPNENIRIGHLWKAVETFAALIMMGGTE